jgi:hypothetical protein
MDEGFKEFFGKVTNPTGKNYHKIKNSWGVYQAFRHIQSHRWYNIGRPLDRKTFYAIIRSINLLLADNLANGMMIKFPCRMGKLELRKFPKGVSIIDGKLKNTYPIDWYKTLELWYNDPEAHENKILVRDEQPFVYTVLYNVYNANYENKHFYKFTLNYHIKKALKENIKNGKTDTLW